MPFMDTAEEKATHFGTNVVGDINSTEKGSGARYNGGKPCMHLIPVSIIAKTEEHRPRNLDTVTEDTHRAIDCLVRLGLWQEGHLSIYEVISCLPPDVWKDCAAVFDFGRKKYAEWNWAKGMAWSIPTASAVRHLLFGILNNEYLDPESGLSHWGHIACNLVMLAQYEKTYIEGDDRPLQYLNPEPLMSGV